MNSLSVNGCLKNNRSFNRKNNSLIPTVLLILEEEKYCISNLQVFRNKKNNNQFNLNVMHL